MRMLLIVATLMLAGRSCATDPAEQAKYEAEQNVATAKAQAEEVEALARSHEKLVDLCGKVKTTSGEIL